MPTLIALAVSAFTSATLLPGSSEAVIVAMRLTNAAPAWQLLLVASLANIAGSCVNWAMGRYFVSYVGRKWFPVTQRQIDRASVWYKRYGWPSLLFSWVPIIGDPLTVVAGFLRTPFIVFVVVVAFAKTARYAALLWFADMF